jgi:hypothetical protein
MIIDSTMDMTIMMAMRLWMGGNGMVRTGRIGMDITVTILGN